MLIPGIRLISMADALFTAAADPNDWIKSRRFIGPTPGIESKADNIACLLLRFLW